MITSRHALQILLERWQIISIAAVFGAAIGVAWTFLASPIYQSTAQIVVDVRAPETIGTQSVADQLSSDYLLTQEDIIRSDRVALQVVSKLGGKVTNQLADNFGWTFRDGAKNNFVASQLGRGLKINDSAVNSRVISLGYISSDPKTAADLANAFAESYADVTVDLQAEPARRASARYNQQMTALQRKLEISQKRLARRSRELGITSSQEQADPESVRLEALSGQLAAAQAANAATQSRTGERALPDALTNPVVQGLQAELAKLETQRQLLSTTVGANNIDMKSVNNQISEIRRQIGTQQALIRQSVSASSAQSGNAVVQLQREVERARSRVIAARSNKSEVAVLEQDVRNGQALYDQMAARKSQLDLLSEAGQTNISFLTQGYPARYAIWPRPKILILGGFVVGGLLSSMIILLIGVLDRRLRNAQEIEAWLGIPNLGEMRDTGQFVLETPYTRKFGVPNLAGLLPKAAK